MQIFIVRSTYRFVILFSIALAGCSVAVDQKMSVYPTTYDDSKTRIESSDPMAKAWIEISDEVAIKIDSNWHQPASWIGKSATVRLLLNSDGVVQNVQIEKTSGDSSFDEYVVTAIKEASPLPVPDDPRYRLLDQPIEVSFQPSPQP